MARLLFSATIIFLISSCVIEKHKEPLIGDWTLHNWEVKSTKEKLSGQKMDFTFKDNDRYIVDYGSEEEKGKWHVSGNNLYTTEDDNIQKMVKITKLVNDTLEFEMNRSGRLEIVVLVKK